MKQCVSKRIKWKHILILGLLIFVILFFVKRHFTLYGEEWKAVQAIAENTEEYAEDLAKLGYQVSVYDPLKDMVEEMKDDALKYDAVLYYVEGIYHPVLILTDETGGIWFFYHGFDQYAQESTNLELMKIDKDEEQMLNVRTQLWMKKVKENRTPSEFNFAKQEKDDYYDMEIELYITGQSPTTGEEVYFGDKGFSSTRYCSNNFEECKRFFGLDPEEANRYADYRLKERFTPEQLLSFYKQGLALQEQLMELYHAKQ